MWFRTVWRPWVAHVSDPPLDMAGMLQKKRNSIPLVPVLLQKLPEVCQFAHSSPLGAFTPDFLSGYTPPAFATPKAPTRQWGYLPIVGV